MSYVKVKDPTTGKEYWGDDKDADHSGRIRKFERHHGVKAVPFDMSPITVYPGPEPVKLKKLGGPA